MSNGKELAGCKNHYSKESIFDLFMESDEDMERCKGCDKFQYISGTMTCKYLNQLSER